MSAAAGAGKNNNNNNNNNNDNGQDELSRYIKEAYDSFKSGYSLKEEFGKIEKKEYRNKNIFERLEDLGLSKIAVPGDGDCLYYSIEMYLKLTGAKYYDNSGNEINVNNLSLRDMVANEIFSDKIHINSGMKKKSHYAAFMGKSDEWLDKNEKKLRTPGSWNNEIGEIPNQIIAKLLGLDIIIYAISNYHFDKETQTQIEVPDYLAESKVGVPGKPKGTVYIVNSGGHYEALIPSSLLANERVKERVKQLQDYQKQKSKESRKKVRQTKKAEVENKARKRANARATQKKSKPKSNIGSESEESKKATIEKEIENALLMMLSLEVKPKRSSRLAAKKSNAANALKKAAVAGPASSNSNSEPAGGAGKKSKSTTVKKPKRKLTKAQQMEYNSWMNQGMNSNNAYALATAI
jgi:hypothetical protein